MRGSEEDVTDHGLIERIDAQRRAALASGALGPIETRTETVVDQGIPFILRTVSSLAQKQAAQRRARASGHDADPFLPPYEAELHVGPVRPDHVALLNKFPVLEGHLLVVTREYAPQHEPLTRADCEAWLRTMAAMDGLAFFNSDTMAGASQPHRHLQCVVPREPLPISQLLDAGGHQGAPFVHACAPFRAEWLEDPVVGAQGFHDEYRALLVRAGLGDPEAGELAGPYNLAATRELMWLVPRRAEHCGPVGVNALGFAGMLLAANAEQAEYFRREGPLRILDAVAGLPEATQ